MNKLARVLSTSPSQASSVVSRMLEQIEMYIRDARLSIFDLRSPALKTHDLTTALDELGHRITEDHGIAFRTNVINMRAKLPPERIGSSGQLQEWLEDVDGA